MDDTQGQGGSTPTSDVPAEPAAPPTEPVGEAPVSAEPTTPEPAPQPETGDTTGDVNTGGGEPVVGDEGTDNGPSPV